MGNPGCPVLRKGHAELGTFRGFPRLAFGQLSLLAVNISQWGWPWSLALWPCLQSLGWPQASSQKCLSGHFWGALQCRPQALPCQALSLSSDESQEWVLKNSHMGKPKSECSYLPWKWLCDVGTGEEHSKGWLFEMRTMSEFKSFLGIQTHSKEEEMSRTFIPLSYKSWCITPDTTLEEWFLLLFFSGDCKLNFRLFGSETLVPF